MKNLELSIYWFLAFYCLFSSLGPLNGMISYGTGLGDLAMVIVNVLLFLLVIIVNFVSTKSDEIKKRSRRFSILIFLVMNIYSTYSFTIGRGAESVWNGDVFYPQSK